MRNVIFLKNNLIGVACASLFLSIQAATHAIAQDVSSSTNATVRAMLPPIPVPQDVPKPGPTNDLPYAPQPILQGGVVIPLFPPDSPYLNTNRIREAEVYSVSKGAPGRINYIVNIHNPSIEVHTVDGGLNTGAAVILAAGGGHNTLNVGGESADFVPFFYNYGVNTVILRNRLRRDGYNPKTDEVYDAQQAIRLVRAHAKEWNIDPNKIGIMGFSAGAELVAAAAIGYDDFDQKNNDPSDPLAGISSRPDFVGIIYPGPSPFARNASPPFPRNVPPAFIAGAGSGDRGHAIWANEYFLAMLQAGIPNIEMHIYGNGRHPGDTLTDGTHMTGGLTDRNHTPYGTWQYRFIDWFRDLGFLQKPGVETKAARDIVDFLKQPPPGVRRGDGPGRSGNANTNAVSSGAAPLSEAQRDFMKWRFGMFVHFNLGTFADRDWASGYEDPALFNPTKLDCGQWADAAKAAGMTYMVLTVKHTEGIALYDSAVTTHDITLFKNFRGGKGDIVREFVDACRSRGLKVGLYYCFPGDYSDAAHHNAPPPGKLNLHGLPPEAEGDYTGFIKKQLAEMLTNYGPIDLLWIDQLDNKYTKAQWPEILAHIRSLQPHCLVLGNNSARLQDSDVLSREFPWKHELPPADNTAPTEVCDTIQTGSRWFWREVKAPSDLQEAAAVVDRLKKCNAANANYLLNVPPDRDGLISGAHLQRLREIGDLARSSDAKLAADH